MRKGDRFIAYHDDLPRRRLFIEVSRVARDLSWADIKVCNCFVMWTKRQPLKESDRLPFSIRTDWTQADIDEQYRRWDEVAFQ